MVVNICIGSSCHLKGSYNVIQTLQQLIKAQNLQGEVEIKAQFCMKRCQQGVCVTVDGEAYSVSPENVNSFFASVVLPQTSRKVP